MFLPNRDVAMLASLPAGNSDAVVVAVHSALGDIVPDLSGIRIKGTDCPETKAGEFEDFRGERHGGDQIIIPHRTDRGGEAIGQFRKDIDPVTCWHCHQ